jgi:hypothetical protein
VLAAGWERERERKAGASQKKGGGTREGGSGRHVVEERPVGLAHAGLPRAAQLEGSFGVWCRKAWRRRAVHDAGLATGVEGNGGGGSCSGR